MEGGLFQLPARTTDAHEVDPAPREQPGEHPRERDRRRAAPVEPSGWDIAAPPRRNEDLQSRLDQLQEAANTASGHVRNVYLTFLLFGLYLAIIFGSTTHEQLLRAGPVTLPLLDVGLPLVGFYWVAPALFVLLHLNLLLQLYLLSGKLHRLDRASRELGNGRRARDRWAQIHPFPFSHLLIGRQHGRLMRSLLWLVVWLTVLVLPVVLLLAGQVRFLPYHDAWTTMWHRALVAMDLFLILLFWRPIRHPEGRWLAYLGGSLPGTLAALALCFLIFTFPGEVGEGGDPMEELLLTVAPTRWIDPGEAPSRPVLAEPFFGPPPKPEPMLWPARHLFDGLPFLERNLVVRETNLVGSWPTKAQIEQYGEDLAWQNFGAPPNLRGRDLRYADLSDSILVRGDFRDADLQGAILVRANLEGALFQGAEVQRATFRFANLRGANLSPANLQGADLGGANLQRASLSNTDLQGAILRSANLQGAVLSCVLGNCVKLQGADLGAAELQGAVLRGAKLHGADLENANLKGAILSCDPLGSCVSLQGADLRGAHLQAADLRGARLWAALLDGDRELGERWLLADLRGLDLHGVQDRVTWIQELVAEISDEVTRERVASRLGAALPDDGRSEVPRFPKAWRSAPKVMFDAHDVVPQQLGWGARVWATVEDYDEDLASFLGELACGDNATVDMAHGLARRVLQEQEVSWWLDAAERVYARRLAARLSGDDCAPAEGLPEEVQKRLQELAAR